MKVYLVLPVELDIECNYENFDLNNAKVFNNYDLAYNCLMSWIDDILKQDDNLYYVQNNDEEYTILNHIVTAYGDDFDVPCFHFWFLEKEIEA